MQAERLLQPGAQIAGSGFDEGAQCQLRADRPAALFGGFFGALLGGGPDGVTHRQRQLREQVVVEAGDFVRPVH